MWDFLVWVFPYLKWLYFITQGLYSAIYFITLLYVIFMAGIGKRHAVREEFDFAINKFAFICAICYLPLLVASVVGGIVYGLYQLCLIMIRGIKEIFGRQYINDCE